MKILNKYLKSFGIIGLASASLLMFSGIGSSHSINNIVPRAKASYYSRSKHNFDVYLEHHGGMHHNKINKISVSHRRRHRKSIHHHSHMRGIRQNRGIRHLHRKAHRHLHRGAHHRKHSKRSRGYFYRSINKLRKAGTYHQRLIIYHHIRRVGRAKIKEHERLEHNSGIISSHKTRRKVSKKYRRNNPSKQRRIIREIRYAIKKARYYYYFE